jgi:small ligand-binding sensory domain FIST
MRVPSREAATLRMLATRPMSAASFRVDSASRPDEIAAGLAEARLAVKNPTAGVVFVSGGLVAQLAATVERVRAEWKGIPLAVVPAAGVLNERAEVEGQSAAAGVLWAGGRAVVFAASDDEPDLGAALTQALRDAGGERPGTALLFARPDSFRADAVEMLPASLGKLRVLGAGTAGRSAVVVDAEGRSRRGRITGMVLGGLAPPIVVDSPACKLLGEFAEIEEVEAGMVLRVGGRPALDVLTAGAASTGGTQPLVLAAIAEDEGGAEAVTRERTVVAGSSGSFQLAGFGTVAARDAGLTARARYLVRPVRGIDPARRGVLVGPDAARGALLAFAARDADAARKNLEEAVREVAYQAKGSAPRFALFLSCAGRGQGLYGAPSVDARILRQRFPDLPIAGMHSSFEIAPRGDGKARMQLYTGVLALFRSPS